MNRVFISYSRRNRTFAERLARDLNDAGLDVWIDFRQIHAGEMWEQEIFRGIERSEIVVVCLSPDAVASEWVQREVLTAREQEKFILPVMVKSALDDLEQVEALRWMLQIQYIDFEGGYETAFPELLRALPGKRRVGAYDSIDSKKVPNPFKGLEAFQQTDAAFFFGREKLIQKALDRLKEDRATRFLGIVGASGSGKSSLVRAGVLPALRNGALPGSDQWRIVIFTPGDHPIESLGNRLSPLMTGRDATDIDSLLRETADYIDVMVDYALEDAPPDARLIMVIDQFEEVFTRATEAEAQQFLNIMYRAVTQPLTRAHVLITMRADFFDRLSQYPFLAELFEQENMVIVTEMTPQELLRTIEGPAAAVGLVYDPGLPQRILEEVRRQPGSLPLLQYALKELYKRREKLRLTTAAYEAIGGVQQALAQHAEDIYVQLNAAQQGIMRRLMLSLVEISESGEATRRRVNREDIQLRDVSERAIQELIDLLASAESRLLITSRTITARGRDDRPVTTVEVSHEALIREWSRFREWVADNLENLRLGSEIMQAANDWLNGNHDKAYLLTGNRLTRAEVWMDESDETPLQREFINASLVESERREKLRQAQMERELALQRKSTRRLRLFVGVLILAFLASAVLSLLAIDAQDRANQAANRAELREQEAVTLAERALSLALSASASRALGDQESDLAAMLAVYANQIEVPPPQSERTLADVVYAPGTRQVLDAEGLELTDAALSPDGNTAVTGAGTDLIIWDLTTGTEALRLSSGDDNAATGHTDRIRTVAYSPNGRIASGGDDTVIILWDTASSYAPQILAGHTSPVSALAFSPDGTRLLTGDDSGRVLLWDVASGAIISQDIRHSETIHDLGFNSLGDAAAAASNDGRVSVWSLTNGLLDWQRYLETTADAAGHTGAVLALDFAPAFGSTALVTGGADTNLILWNFQTGQRITNFDDHGAAVTAIDYLPDSSGFFSGDEGGIVIRWDLVARELEYAFSDHTATISALAVQADGDTLLSSSLDATVRLWDIQDVALVQSFVGHDRTGLEREVVAVYSPDGERALSGSGDGTLRLWDRGTGLTIQEFEIGGHDGAVTAVDFAPNSDTVVSGGVDGRVIVWDVDSGAVRVDVRAYELPVRAVAYTPTSDSVLAGYDNGGVVRWTLSGVESARYGPAEDKDSVAHVDAVNDLAVSPDGVYFLSASRDESLILWDIATAEVINSYKGHNDAVLSVVFDGPGVRALSGADNGSIILWDMSGDLRTANPRTSVIRRFDGHDDAVRAVDFSPASAHILSASEDGTMRMWDETTGFEVRRFIADRSAVFVSVDFSDDSQTVLTGMSNGDLLAWRVLPFPDNLLAYMAANRRVREPSCNERDQFEIPPPCIDSQPQVTATPFPLPTATPSTDNLALRSGSQAVVNMVTDETLFVREQPTLASDPPIARLNDGDTVTILADAPVIADGLAWWNVQMADGTTGWAVASLPDINVQTLIPTTGY